VRLGPLRVVGPDPLPVCQVVEEGIELLVRDVIDGLASRGAGLAAHEKVDLDCLDSPADARESVEEEVAHESKSPSTTVSGRHRDDLDLHERMLRGDAGRS
jgi:hypothetical protein